MHMRDFAMSGVSICPSDCLSHAGIESKLIAVGSYGFTVA